MNLALKAAYRTGLRIDPQQQFHLVNNLTRRSVVQSVFNPVLAFLTLEPRTTGEESVEGVGDAVAEGEGEGEQSPAMHLSSADFDALLRHQRGTLRATFQRLTAVLPCVSFCVFSL